MRHRRPGRHHQRPRRPAPHKPPLSVSTTTLWDYPSQHYGEAMQGDQAYVGATPSYVIWNVLMRYTAPGELVVDPFCGSGTTLDVARDTGRRARGFDLSPYRPDIERADARRLPLENERADLVFMDPPYGDHIDYSDDPACIGKLSAFDPAYAREMGKALREAARVLKRGGVLALYVCDFFKKGKGFVPTGFLLLEEMRTFLTPIDIVAVVRHNKALQQGNFHKAAAQENFFLRGFNYLFVMRKP